MPAINVDSYSRFHLAFPVTELAQARAFYDEFLNCPEERSSPEWMDFNFHGHQIVAHLVLASTNDTVTNLVNGQHVSARHFGVILYMNEWRRLAEKLTQAQIKFVIKPHIRFQGEQGEQAAMFFLAPFGNALEFKAFEDMSRIFAK